MVRGLDTLAAGLVELPGPTAARTGSQQVARVEEDAADHVVFGGQISGDGSVVR